MPAPLDLIARHLDDQRRLGRTRLQLTPESRVFLRGLAKRPRQSESRLTPKPGPEATPAVPAGGEPARPMSPAAGRVAGEAPPPTSDFTTATDLASLRRMVEGDARLTGFASLREQMVFAVGSAEAAIVFVGEAPGQEEERRREPFVGPAGQLLNKIIGAMQLSREAVYISNIVKYRPRIESLREQGSRNRKPTKAEMAAFRPVVLRELELIRPRCVVALGGTAHQGLLEEEIPVSRARGRVRRLGGLDLPVVSTYHPSYLLRQQGSREEMKAKRLLWEDMLLALETAELPVTVKMQGYFRQ